MQNPKKWYFSINQKGFDSCFEQIVVAVRSCFQNTGLEPVCIYGGSDVSQIEKLKSLGVNVIQHISSFDHELRIGYGEKYNNFVGHWLRVDIPTIESDDDYILYTDTDVVFLKNPVNIGLPNLMSAAPEFKKDDYSKLNSGVMVMNVKNLRLVQDTFVESIKDRLISDFKYPAHDQESYNRFFLSKYDRMDPVYNWKVYWGVNEDAEILHLHGPKFKVIDRMISGVFDKIPEGHVRLWRKNPEAYVEYRKVYDKYL